MLQRAVDIDPSTDHYTGLIALASYHARNGMAEPDDAKKILDLAMAKTEGKNLLVPLAYATTYACVKGNAAVYQKMLNKVHSSAQPTPTLTPLLENCATNPSAARALGGIEEGAYGKKLRLRSRRGSPAARGCAACACASCAARWRRAPAPAPPRLRHATHIKRCSRVRHPALPPAPEKADIGLSKATPALQAPRPEISDLKRR